MRELTIAVLMRFVITPKDPTTALVSLDIREMHGAVQVNDVVMAAVKLEVR